MFSFIKLGALEVTDEPSLNHPNKALGGIQEDCLEEAVFG